MIYDSTIKENKRIAENVYYLKLDINKNFIALPGQFINILVDENYEMFLRRPFSIYNFEKKTIEIVYKVIGKGTIRLSKIKIGTTLNILGPLGNSYIDFFSENNNFLKDILLIGGGTGIASLNFFCEWLSNKNKKFTLLYGVKSKKEIFFIKHFKKFNTIFFTEDGSYEKKGVVTDFIKKFINNNSVIFACGPQPMLKVIQNLKLDNKVYASFESYMGCGFGVCLSCVIPIKEKRTIEYKRVCKEGPVFDLNKVIFR